MRLVSIGTTTLDNARELIAIPEREERAFNLFVKVAGKKSIGRAVAFRRKVLVEFEKLVELMRFNRSVAV